MYVRLKGKQTKLANGLRITNPSDRAVELILEPAGSVKVEEEARERNYVDSEREND